MPEATSALITAVTRCLLVALSGHAELHCPCPLSGVKRTCGGLRQDGLSDASDLRFHANAWRRAVWCTHITLGKSGHRAAHWSPILPACFFGQSAVTSASKSTTLASAPRYLIRRASEQRPLRPHFAQPTCSTSSLPIKSLKMIAPL
jgi:hypothetical protein